MYERQVEEQLAIYYYNIIIEEIYVIGRKKNIGINQCLNIIELLGIDTYIFVIIL